MNPVSGSLRSAEPIISIRNLRKAYGKEQVLHGIDLDVFPGQIIGYIGPNGAGKSTTVRILVGLDTDYEGEVIVAGYDVRQDALEIKKRIGFVPELAELYDVLSPREFLQLIGSLHHLPEAVVQERSLRMLRFFSLEGRADERMDRFSKGMRQKVLLISGLLHDPQIIFLDEPLAGLDANSVILIKEVIARLAARGKTIFYCSHMMDVVEKVSDRIVLINQGRVVADGSLAELRRQGDDSLERIFAQLTSSDDNGRLADDFLSAFGE